MTIIRFFKLIFNYIKAGISDLIWLIVVIITFPIDLTREEKKQNKKKGPLPILLVHGYLHSSAAWLYIRYRLKKSNLGPIYTINLGSPFHSIEEYATKVKEKARTIAEQTGRTDLLLIGHSMGGLVCAYYALHMAPRNSVRAVITMGSPLKGTRTALFGKGACSHQMRYRSAFTQRLVQDIANSENVPFVHMWSAVDPMIRPALSARVESVNAYYEEIEGAGHLDFLYAPSVVNKMIGYVFTFSQQI